MTFEHAVTGSCAADGMCASKCPVGINTGEYVKALRAVSLLCFFVVIMRHASCVTRHIIGRKRTLTMMRRCHAPPFGRQTT